MKIVFFYNYASVKNNAKAKPIAVAIIPFLKI